MKQTKIIGYKKLDGDPRMSDCGMEPILACDDDYSFTIHDHDDDDDGGGGLLSGLAGLVVNALKGYAGD